MSLVRIGDEGGIRIAPEGTYGTAGTVFENQHARSGPLGLRRSLLAPARLSAANPTVRKYGVPFADGEIEVAYDDSRAVVGSLLAAAGQLSTNDYEIDGAGVDGGGVTIWVDYGGYAVRYVGCKPQSLRWDVQPDSPLTLAVGFLGQTAATQTSATITPPSESGIVYESDLSTLTIGGTGL